MPADKPRRPTPPKRPPRPGRLLEFTIIAAALIGVAAIALQGRRAPRPQESPPAAAPQRPAPAASLPAAPHAAAFQCDGRTRCPQMRSCEEARYFVRNCPNTTMDGDNDGEPCESQWCGGL
jgi:Excalibur calcium-binding domain